MRTSYIICGALLLNAGCSVGPNYRRPEIAVPGEYRRVPPSDKAI
jgi:hypothetical protein